MTVFSINRIKNDFFFNFFFKKNCIFKQRYYGVWICEGDGLRVAEAEGEGGARLQQDREEGGVLAGDHRLRREQQDQEGVRRQGEGAAAVADGAGHLGGRRGGAGEDHLQDRHRAVQDLPEVGLRTRRGR